MSEKGEWGRRLVDHIPGYQAESNHHRRIADQSELPISKVEGKHYLTEVEGLVLLAKWESWKRGIVDWITDPSYRQARECEILGRWRLMNDEIFNHKNESN